MGSLDKYMEALCNKLISWLRSPIALLQFSQRIPRITFVDLQWSTAKDFFFSFVFPQIPQPPACFSIIKEYWSAVIPYTLKSLPLRVITPYLRLCSSVKCSCLYVREQGLQYGTVPDGAVLLFQKSSKGFFDLHLGQYLIINSIAQWGL